MTIWQIKLANVTDRRIMYSSTNETEQIKMTKLIAKLGINKNVIREAKEEGGKFYAWVDNANYGSGEWQRVAKTKIYKVAA